MSNRIVSKILTCLLFTLVLQMGCQPPTDTRIIIERLKLADRQDLLNYKSKFSLEKIPVLLSCIQKIELSNLTTKTALFNFLNQCTVSIKTIFVTTKDWIHDESLTELTRMFYPDMSKESLSLIMVFRERFRTIWKYEIGETSDISESSIQQFIDTHSKKIDSLRAVGRKRVSEQTIQMRPFFFKNLTPGALDHEMINAIRSEWLRVKDTDGAMEREFITKNYVIEHKYPCFTQCACMSKHLGQALANQYPHLKVFKIRIYSKGLGINVITGEINISFNSYTKNKEKYSNKKTKLNISWNYHEFVLFESQKGRWIIIDPIILRAFTQSKLKGVDPSKWFSRFKPNSLVLESVTRL